MNISMKLIDQYMDIFFNFSPKSNHLHPLRLVVDEDDNGKFRLEKVYALTIFYQNGKMFFSEFGIIITVLLSSF